MENKAIIYDGTCPMCALYTKGFVKYGFLKAKNRVSFSELNDQHFIEKIDLQKAKNEIPLVDTETGSVIYGIDALLYILSQKIKLIGVIGRTPPVYWFLRKFYKFISFNRRIIVPSKKQELQYDCTPDFNIKYRVLYLIFAWLITSLVLTSYSSLLVGFIGGTSFGREFLICGGQIVFQFTLLFLVKKNKALIFEYLGNMMTVSLIGSILLLPAILINSIVPVISPYFFIVWFMLVVCAMLYDHIRRVSLITAPKWLSLSWVIYRIIVLLIILFL